MRLILIYECPGDDSDLAWKYKQGTPCSKKARYPKFKMAATGFEATVTYFVNECSTI